MKLTAMETKQLGGPTSPYKTKRKDMSAPTQADKDYLTTIKAVGPVTASKMAEIMKTTRSKANWRLDKMRRRGMLSRTMGSSHGEESTFSAA